jgi:rare lipoprotein A (peptidoglycan hydrolase)
VEAQGASKMKRMILILLLWSSQAAAEGMNYSENGQTEVKLEVCIDTARNGVILETRVIENNSVTVQWSMTAQQHCSLVKVFDDQKQSNYFSCFCGAISKN